jgi:putative ABC transport system permease protein
MLRNYLKIAIRNLFVSGRDGSAVYSWINLIGLTIGLAAFLFIAHYIRYELSYDRFHPNHNRMYRLAVERQERGEVTMRSAKTFAGIGDALEGELSELSQYVRILDEECMFEYEPEKVVLNRQRTFWADGNFKDFFNLVLLREGQTELIHQPNHAIISRAAATRLFGNDWLTANSPLGKTVILNGSIPFMIQGVFEDLPKNSHMNVDFVVSYSTLAALIGDFMNTIMPPQRNFVYNYLLFNESETAHLEPLINRIIANHTGQLDEHVSYHFFMQPVSSIYLDSKLSDELNANGSRFFVWALSVAAILIMVVAWINFINLTIAKALNRSREVGIRKAIGALRHQIGFQFAAETLFSGFLALVLVVLIAILFDRTFNRITEIPVSLFSADSTMTWFVFFAAAIIGAVIAGSYPALLMSSFHPIKALRGSSSIHSGNGIFKQGLITFQFGAALLLIACTGAVYYQVEYMRKQPLGADLSQVLVIHSPRSLIANPARMVYFRQFRDQLEQSGAIASVASGGCLPGEKFLYHTENVQAEGLESAVNWSFDVASVDERYLTALDMKLLSGRNFQDQPGEEQNVILNELAILGLGFTDPADAVGKFIRIGESERRQIIGVVANVHFEGLQSSVKPLMLRYGHDYEFGFYPIKISSRNIEQTISSIESQWKIIYPRDPFDYFFLDKFFERQYKNEKAFGMMFGSFAILTIFISGMGLFGLISLTIYQKYREIGIRKVLGASVLSIIHLLLSGFLPLILIASLLFLPMAHFIIERWLSTFAYRFDLPWYSYLIPLIAVLITSILAVGSQTMRAALKNPVDAIAEE